MYHQKVKDKLRKEPNEITNSDDIVLERNNKKNIVIKSKSNFITLPGFCIPIELIDFPEVNQIQRCIELLKKSSYSRRVQAITWRPYTDLYNSEPPCLQRIWLRIYDGKLTMQTTWRSRDHFNAWSANVNGMIQLQKVIANELGVEVGNYLDFSNSLHIYGKDINNCKKLMNEIIIKEGNNNLFKVD
jgi:thymidylate synthase